MLPILHTCAWQRRATSVTWISGVSSSHDLFPSETMYGMVVHAFHITATRSKQYADMKQYMGMCKHMLIKLLHSTAIFNLGRFPFNVRAALAPAMRELPLRLQCTSCPLRDNCLHLQCASCPGAFMPAALHNSSASACVAGHRRLFVPRFDVKKRCPSLAYGSF